MTKDLQVVNVIAKIVEDPDITPMLYVSLQKKRRFSKKKKQKRRISIEREEE